MTHKLNGRSAVARGSAQMRLDGKHNANLLTPPPSPNKGPAVALSASYAARVIASRFGVSVDIASLVAELAGLAVHT